MDQKLSLFVEGLYQVAPVCLPAPWQAGGSAQAGMGLFPQTQVLKDFLADLRLVNEANAHFTLAFRTDDPG